MGTILGFLFGGICLGAIAFAAYIFTKNKKQTMKKAKLMIIASVVVAALFFAMFVFIPFGFVQINTGEIAVVKVFGEAKEVKSSGLHFRNVITTKYDIYNVKTQQMDIKNEVYTKDAQSLSIELSLHYSIMIDKAVEISKTYGDMNDLAQRIKVIAIEKSKVILSAKTAMELIETRATISPAVFNEIKTIENQYFVRFENVVVVDMAFSAAFEKAVEEKMIAQQEVIKATAEKEKAIIKAEQDLAVAKLDAEQALATAKGEADAQVAIAMAQAEILKLKSIETARMLGFKVLELTKEEVYDILDDDGEKIGEETITKIVGYEIDFENSDDKLTRTSISEYLKYIAYLEAWDGKLPTVVTDSNGNIFIPIG